MSLQELVNAIKAYYGCMSEDIRWVSDKFIVRVCNLTTLSLSMKDALEIKEELEESTLTIGC